MSIARCNNLTIDRIDRWLYCPATPPWHNPCPPTEVGNCAGIPDPYRIDRVECSSESLAMCERANELCDSVDSSRQRVDERNSPYPPLDPRSADDPPRVVREQVVQQVFTPVVAGSLLDIWA